MAAFSTPLQRARDVAGVARSRSSPALAGAFQLEKVGFGKRLLVMEYTKEPERCPLQTVKDRERRRRVDEQLERMRQREEDERGLVAMEIKREKKTREVERSRQRAAQSKVEDLKRQEMVKKWRTEQAIVAERDRVHVAERRREVEEKERSNAEAEEAERLRRVPVQCITCKSTGQCLECKGAGVHSATFLAPSVHAHPLEFGTKTRGCTSCLGVNQGIRGELQQGSGVCTACAGVGKFCTGFCVSRVCSPAWKTRSRTGAAKEEHQFPEECKSCGGALRPTLEDAQLLWEQAREQSGGGSAS